MSYDEICEQNRILWTELQFTKQSLFNLTFETQRAEIETLHKAAAMVDAHRHEIEAMRNGREWSVANVSGAPMGISDMRKEIAKGKSSRDKLSKKLETAKQEIAVLRDAAVHADDPRSYEMCKTAQTRCIALEKTQNRIVWNLFYAFVYVSSFYMYKHFQ